MPTQIQNRTVNVARLPESVLDALAAEGIEGGTVRDVLAAYLRWEGIHGYDAAILAIVEAGERTTR